MNYDEFNTEYTRVLDKINGGGCGPAELSGHVSRLRKATAGIQSPAERTQIASDLAALGQMLDVSRRTNNREDVWTVTNKAGEQLIISIEEILHDSLHELGVDPEDDFRVVLAQPPQAGVSTR